MKSDVGRGCFFYDCTWSPLAERIASTEDPLFGVACVACAGRDAQMLLGACSAAVLCIFCCRKRQGVTKEDIMEILFSSARRERVARSGTGVDERHAAEEHLRG